MKFSPAKNMLAVLVACSFLTACGSSSSNKDDREVDQPKVEEKDSVKNVILMIGDGMGPQQIGLLEEYARRAPNSVLASTTTGLQKFADSGRLGLSMNAPVGANPSLVVDSACSASQLATGKGSISEAVGLDDRGNKVETILEKAKAMGKATGLISDTRLTHATPAAFAAHQPHRSYENEIAQDLLTVGVDVMLGGGSRHWVPDTDFAALAAELNAPTHVIKKSKRKDDRNLIKEAQTDGYALAFTKAQLAAATGTKLLGLFDDSAMNDGIEYTNCKNGAQSAKCTDEPSLKDMTMKALDILSKDEDGFFLMIEGGQIDWAGHVNDTGWLLHEMLKFDEAVEAVYEWVKQRDDTLVVITADHETGGFGFAYHKHEIPEGKQLDGDAMNGKEYKPNFNFGSIDTLDKIYAQKKSYYDIFSDVEGDWEFTASTPAEWKAAVNASLHADFHVSDEEAGHIAARTMNDNVINGHKYLSVAELPLINDYSDFYVYPGEDHGPLISRAIGAEQNVAWSNGTHTASPVPVYAFGPEKIANKFSTMQHHTNIGQKLIDALITQ